MNLSPFLRRDLFAALIVLAMVFTAPASLDAARVANTGTEPTQGLISFSSGDRQTVFLEGQLSK